MNTTIKEKFDALFIEIDKKVLAGDFKFISCSEYVAILEVDGIEIGYWIANDPKESFTIYEFDECPVKDGHFKSALTTQEKRLAAYGKVKPFILEYQQNKLAKQKEEQIKKLQSELEKLKS
jgi:hydrogenase maturation factor HypE